MSGRCCELPSARAAAAGWWREKRGLRAHPNRRSLSLLSRKRRNRMRAAPAFGGCLLRAPRSALTTCSLKRPNNPRPPADLIFPTQYRHNNIMRFLVPALALSATLQLHAVDWPQYRGPSGDGKSSEKITIPAGKTAPKQVWKTPSEGGFSSFVVAKG